MLRTVPSRSIAKNMIARSARYTTDPWARPRRTKEHHRSLRSLHYKLWSDLHWSWSDLLFSFIFLSQITYFWSLPFPFYFFGQYLWSIYNYWSLRSLQILIDGRGRATPNNMIARSARYTTDPWARPRPTKQHDRSLRSLHYRSMGEAAPHQTTWSLAPLATLQIHGRGRATPNNTIEHDSFSHDPWLNPQGTPHHTVRSHRSWSHLFIFWSFIIFSFSFTILSYIQIKPHHTFTFYFI
jgi:hypothetical protein